MNPTIHTSINPGPLARGAATLALALTCALAALSQVALPLKAQDLYIASFGNGTINEYALSGTIIRTNVINGLFEPGFDVIAGNDLFVVNGGIIGEYMLSGQTVNALLVQMNSAAEGIAVSGTNLFVVTDPGEIAEYTTSGAVVNPSLISGLSEPEGIAISGTNLFVAYGDTIGEYTTSGATVNASLISEPDQEPFSIAISGTNVFVSNVANNTIGEYTTSGTTVNASLITGLNGPYAIAIFGTNLYVANWGAGTIGEYTTSGTKINASLISGLFNPWGIAIGPPPQLNITAAGNQSFLVYPYAAFGTNYILQSSTNLASTNWVTVTNGVPIIGVAVTNNSPATFFRVVLAP